MADKAFEAIVLEVLKSGAAKEVPKEVAEEFYSQRFEQISTEIDRIRLEQRKAFEETKAVRLA